MLKILLLIYIVFYPLEKSLAAETKELENTSKQLVTDNTFLDTSGIDLPKIDGSFQKNNIQAPKLHIDDQPSDTSTSNPEKSNFLAPAPPLPLNTPVPPNSSIQYPIKPRQSPLPSDSLPTIQNSKPDTQQNSTQLPLPTQSSPTSQSTKPSTQHLIQSQTNSQKLPATNLPTTQTQAVDSTYLTEPKAKIESIISSPDQKPNLIQPKSNTQIETTLKILPNSSKINTDQSNIKTEIKTIANNVQEKNDLFKKQNLNDNLNDTLDFDPTKLKIALSDNEEKNYLNNLSYSEYIRVFWSQFVSSKEKKKTKEIQSYLNNYHKFYLDKEAKHKYRN